MSDAGCARLDRIVLDHLRVAGAVQVSRLSGTLRGMGWPQFSPEDCRASVARLVAAKRAVMVADDWIREL